MITDKERGVALLGVLGHGLLYPDILFTSWSRLAIEVDGGQEESLAHSACVQETVSLLSYR